MKELDYMDMKNAVDDLKKQIEQTGRVYQMLQINLKAFEEKLSKMSPPDKKELKQIKIKS